MDATGANTGTMITVTTNASGIAKIRVRGGTERGELHIHAAVVSSGFCADPGTTRILTLVADLSMLSNTWGRGAYGVIGDGEGNNRAVPVSPMLPKGSYLKAGSALNALFTVDTNGQIWAWGQNVSGVLGIGAITPSYIRTPTQVQNLDRVTFVGVTGGGDGAVAALTDTAQVYSWGYGGLGSTGLGHTGNIHSPTRIAQLQNITQVAMGQRGGIALDTGSKVYTWGTNAQGELGTGSRGGYSTAPNQVRSLNENSFNIVQVAASWHGRFALADNGDLYAWGAAKVNGTSEIKSTPTPILGGVKKVFANYYIAWAIMEDGSVRAWGRERHGVFGRGFRNTLDSAKVRYAYVGLPPGAIIDKIVNGFDTSVVKLTDGRLFSAGYNAAGNTGTGIMPTDIYTPMKVLIEGDKAIDVSCSSYSAVATLMETNGEAARE